MFVCVRDGEWVDLLGSMEEREKRGGNESQINVERLNG